MTTAVADLVHVPAGWEFTLNDDMPDRWTTADNCTFTI